MTIAPYHDFFAAAAAAAAAADFACSRKPKNRNGKAEGRLVSVFVLFFGF
jgi:hypothetical protein